MKKVLATTLGVILATGAVSALAGKQDREHLALCKADIEAHFGERPRMRLRSIKHLAAETQLRLMVTPANGGNRVVVCHVATDGGNSLTDGDGLALAPLGDGEALSLAR